MAAEPVTASGKSPPEGTNTGSPWGGVRQVEGCHLRCVLRRWEEELQRTPFLQDGRGP